MNVYILTSAILLSVMAMIFKNEDMPNRIAKALFAGMAIWGFVTYFMS